ncbi:MAG TPA: hypothetical protein VIF62_24540 [Labilithrix sp.]|jgi:hypothetical protein
MRRINGVLAASVAALFTTTSSIALAQVQSAPPAVPVPQYAPPQAAPPVEEAPPPETQWSVPQQGGRWVYTTDHGWVWIPDTATPVEYEGVPYVWMYTPSVGWRWYVSPWGRGRYHYGTWVRHTWQPRAGARVWVAPQHVHARLGHPRNAPAPRSAPPPRRR